jgi:hypothetical protein
MPSSRKIKQSIKKRQYKINVHKSRKIKKMVHRNRKINKTVHRKYSGVCIPDSNEKNAIVRQQKLTTCRIAEDKDKKRNEAIERAQQLKAEREKQLQAERAKQLQVAKQPVAATAAVKQLLAANRPVVAPNFKKSGVKKTVKRRGKKTIRRKSKKQ